jgi:hypothetical protein
MEKFDDDDVKPLHRKDCPGCTSVYCTKNTQINAENVLQVLETVLFNLEVETEKRLAKGLPITSLQHDMIKHRIAVIEARMSAIFGKLLKVEAKQKDTKSHICVACEYPFIHGYYNDRCT